MPSWRFHQLQAGGQAGRQRARLSSLSPARDEPLTSYAPWGLSPTAVIYAHTRGATPDGRPCPVPHAVINSLGRRSFPGDDEQPDVAPARVHMASWTTRAAPVKMGFCSFFFSPSQRNIWSPSSCFPRHKVQRFRRRFGGFYGVRNRLARPISTQVLFYVLRPDGHKRAPMHDDVYFMFGRKLGFFFFRMFRLDRLKVPSVLTVHIILVSPNGKQHRSSGRTLWEKFRGGVTCGCECVGCFFFLKQQQQQHREPPADRGPCLLAERLGRAQPRAQWQPQARTTMLRYFLRMTLELSSK